MARAAVDRAESQTQDRPYDFVRRLSVRWIIVYLLSYTFFGGGALQMVGYFPGWTPLTLVNRLIYYVWQAVVPLVGKFFITHPFSTAPYNGDRIFDYIQIGIIVAISFAIALIWSLVDPRKERERTLYEVTRVILRYELAFILFGYGISKVIPGGQFPYPGPSLLMQPLGSISPYDMEWAALGYSQAIYGFFGGLGETVGSILVLFRRTTTFGAVIIAGIMANVTMLDLAYNVPVKSFAANLCIMAVFLAAPDLWRIGNALFFYRPLTAPENHKESRPHIVGSVIMKVLFLYYAVLSTASVAGEVTASRAAGNLPMVGLYQVETSDSKSKPSTDWQHVAIEGHPNFVVESNGTIKWSGFYQTLDVRTTDDNIKPYVLQIRPTDPTHGVLKLAPGFEGSADWQPHGGIRGGPTLLHYVLINNDINASENKALAISGVVNGSPITMRWTQVDTSKLPLNAAGVQVIEHDDWGPGAGGS